MPSAGLSEIILRLLFDLFDAGRLDPAAEDDASAPRWHLAISRAPERRLLMRIEATGLAAGWTPPKVLLDRRGRPRPASSILPSWSDSKP